MSAAIIVSCAALAASLLALRAARKARASIGEAAMDAKAALALHDEQHAVIMAMQKELASRRRKGKGACERNKARRMGTAPAGKDDGTRRRTPLVTPDNVRGTQSEKEGEQ